MNTSHRSKSRIDRVALGATFAAALLTLGAYALALQPSTAPLLATAELIALAETPATAPAAVPCGHDTAKPRPCRTDARAARRSS